MQELLIVIQFIVLGSIVGVILVFIARFFSKLIAEHFTVSAILAAVVTTIVFTFLTLGKLLATNVHAAIVVATIASGIVGALMTLLVQWILDNLRRKERVEGFYKAVYGELKEVWNLYNEEVGARWEELPRERRAVFPLNMSLTQDYFTVYHSNADLVGQTPKSDLELRSNIVETYTLLKVLIDYYKQNNRLLDENGGLFDKDGNLFDEDENLLDEDGKPWGIFKGLFDAYGEDIAKRKIAKRNLDILEFTQRLRNRHFRFKTSKEKLFVMLEDKFPELSDRGPAKDST